MASKQLQKSRGSWGLGEIKFCLSVQEQKGVSTSLEMTALPHATGFSALLEGVSDLAAQNAALQERMAAQNAKVLEMLEKQQQWHEELAAEVKNQAFPLKVSARLVTIFCCQKAD